MCFVSFLIVIKLHKFYDLNELDMLFDSFIHFKGKHWIWQISENGTKFNFFINFEKIVVKFNTFHYFL